MGKNDFLSPKAIANRIKAKGLQKLRWYCQMCQKSCRDENGFKCHLTSEGHKRQMMVFGQAPMRVVDGYSEEFERTFLEHLRQSHGSTRVSAKVVYNEFINDRHHIHMNSTQWLTLTEFVKYLGKEGLCRVDETPKGWFISLIQKDPMEQLSDERRIKRSRAEKEEGERQQEALEAQIDKAQAAVDHSVQDASAVVLDSRQLVRGESEQPLRLTLAAQQRPSSMQWHRGPPKGGSVLDLGAAGPSGGEATKRHKAERPKSKLEQLMQQDQARKAAVSANGHRSDCQNGAKAGNGQPNERSEAAWLHRGIVVKVMAKELQDYYKRKGIVQEVATAFVAEVCMLESRDVLRIDQAQLETVLPSPGGAVLVLMGQHAGARATMLGVDTQRFKAQVQLQGGTELWLDYDYVCKLQGA